MIIHSDDHGQVQYIEIENQDFSDREDSVLEERIALEAEVM